MKVPRLKFDSLHDTSNDVCTVQPIVAVRYNNLKITITRMITIKRPIMMTSLVLGRPDESPQVKIQFPSRSVMKSVPFNP